MCSESEYLSPVQMYQGFDCTQLQALRFHKQLVCPLYIESFSSKKYFKYLLEQTGFFRTRSYIYHQNKTKHMATSPSKDYRSDTGQQKCQWLYYWGFRSASWQSFWSLPFWKECWVESTRMRLKKLEAIPFRLQFTTKKSQKWQSLEFLLGFLFHLCFGTEEDCKDIVGLCQEENQKCRSPT